VRPILEGEADMVMGPLNTAMSIAYIKACQTYGVNIPTIASPHHTIYAYASAMKTYEPFEGHLVVAAHASVTEKDSPAWLLVTLPSTVGHSWLAMLLALLNVYDMVAPKEDCDSNGRQDVT
jgi:hypothetical protein